MNKPQSPKVCAVCNQILGTHDAHGLVVFVSGVRVAYVHDGPCQWRLKEQRAEGGKVVEFKPLNGSSALCQPSTTARSLTAQQKLADAFVESSGPH